MTQEEVLKAAGRMLRRLRRDTGMSLVDPAHFMGVSIATLSEWERGERLPSEVHLKTLEAFYADRTLPSPHRAIEWPDSGIAKVFHPNEKTETAPSFEEQVNGPLNTVMDAAFAESVFRGAAFSVRILCVSHEKLRAMYEREKKRAGDLEAQFRHWAGT